MKANSSFLIFLLVTMQALFAKAPVPELTQDFWNDPAFVRGFMGDYGFRSEVEPRVDKAEQFILREVVAKAENQMEQAIVYLEEKITNETSAALDFALATMYYQLGRLTPSEQTYEKALKKFPSFYEPGRILVLCNLVLESWMRLRVTSLKRSAWEKRMGYPMWPSVIVIFPWGGWCPRKMLTAWVFYCIPKVQMQGTGW